MCVHGCVCWCTDDSLVPLLFVYLLRWVELRVSFDLSPVFQGSFEKPHLRSLISLCLLPGVAPIFVWVLALIHLR